MHSKSFKIMPYSIGDIYIYMILFFYVRFSALFSLDFIGSVLSILSVSVGRSVLHSFLKAREVILLCFYRSTIFSQSFLNHMNNNYIINIYSRALLFLCATSLSPTSSLTKSLTYWHPWPVVRRGVPSHLQHIPASPSAIYFELVILIPGLNSTKSWLFHLFETD